MNILVVSTMLPMPVDNGSATRLFNIYSRLRKHHRVAWVSPVYEGRTTDAATWQQQVDYFEEIPHKDVRALPSCGWRKLLMRFVAPLQWERLFVYCFGQVQSPALQIFPDTPLRLEVVRRAAQQFEADVVVCELEGAAELVPPELHQPKIISLHNVMSQLFKRSKDIYPANFEDKLFFVPELLKVQRYERQKYRRFARAVTVSSEDTELLRKRCANLVVDTIPNGVDVDFYDPKQVADVLEQPCTVAYIANFNYAPNTDAIVHFCKTTWPLVRSSVPSAELWLVGRDAPQEVAQVAGVKLMGFVPDIRTVMHQSSVIIAPLRVGGGTRLKILEAFAMAKPVVSTTLGAEGIVAQHEHNILIADVPTAFAAAIVRLFNDPHLRQSLGMQARKLVVQEYNWDVLAHHFERVLTDVAQTPARHRTQ